MIEKLIKILEYYIEGKLTINTNLKDYQINELDLVDIMMDIEDEFDVVIDDYEFNKLYTINDIYNYIKELLD